MKFWLSNIEVNVYDDPEENFLKKEATTFLRETISRAEKRITTCVIYSPNGWGVC